MESGEKGVERGKRRGKGEMQRGQDSKCLQVANYFVTRVHGTMEACQTAYICTSTKIIKNEVGMDVGMTPCQKL